MSKHDCKYWRTNLRHHRRDCGFCGRTQYNYGGQWKNELKGPGWLSEFMQLGGTGFDAQIEIGVAYQFEAFCTESWDVTIKIAFLAGRLAGRVFGPFENFNQAQHEISRAWQQAKTDAQQGRSDGK